MTTPPKPEEHFCLICERQASYGFKWAEREGGRMSGRMTSSIYAHGNGDTRTGDPASVRLLAKKYWHERGGAILSAEQLECLSPRAHAEVVAVIEATHGKRKGARR